MSLTDADRDTVGYRYLQWVTSPSYESTLTSHEKAIGHDQFAAEFEALPKHLEPHRGWAATMAYLNRRIARRQRGEPVDDWDPPRFGGTDRLSEGERT